MLFLSIVDAIGSTPLVMLKRLSERFGLKARIYVKLEYMNPTGSHKDRIAYYMIRDAIEKRGLKPGDIVTEASSGNTAISVAFVAKLFGLRAIIAIPREVSEVKVALVKSFGAGVVSCSSDPSAPDYCNEVAKKLAEEYGGVYLNQHGNYANVRAHYETTAPEIWRDLDGNIDAFVMGIGTGGTITGVGKYLKERKSVLIVGVTPRGSALVGGRGVERIEGLSSRSVPPLLDRSVVDRIIEVSFDEALEGVKLLLEEGIAAGPSSGANLVAALRIAKELDGANIVTIAADSLFRYPDVMKRIGV